MEDRLICKARDLLQSSSFFSDEYPGPSPIQWTQSALCPAANDETACCYCNQGLISKSQMKHFDHELTNSTDNSENETTVHLHLRNRRTREELQRPRRTASLQIASLNKSRTDRSFAL